MSCILKTNRIFREAFSCLTSVVTRTTSPTLTTTSTSCNSRPKWKRSDLMRTMSSQSTRSLWRSFALILLLISLFAIYLLVKPGNSTSITLVDNLFQGILEGVGLLLTLPLFLPGGGRTRPIRAGRLERRPRRRRTRS